MAVSKKHQEYANEYIKNNYDRINIVVPKGNRERLKNHAASVGESLNAFVARATDEQIKRDHDYEINEKINVSYSLPYEDLLKLDALFAKYPEMKKEVRFSISVSETIPAAAIESLAETFAKLKEGEQEPPEQGTEAEGKAAEPLEQGTEAEEGEA